MSAIVDSGVPWSNNPNAPNITSSLHFDEKANFAGDFIAAMLYGIVIVLFFQCMGALLNPINHTRGRIQWGLVAHTAIMFSFVTIATAMGFNLQSISRVDNRKFPGVDGVLPPGPLGYKYSIYNKAISLVPNFTFQLNQWLADGLLLYRCYIICGTNNWVIAFPCLMYLTSVAIGIVYVYKAARPIFMNSATAIDFGTSYFAVSISLNVLLTLMIITRLILHMRDARNTMGDTRKTGALYRTIIVMLIESSALYAVGFLLFIGPYGAGHFLQDTFWPILNETQVIAPFLIIRRVANRRALTGDSLASGSISPILFNSLRTSAIENGTSSWGDRVAPMDTPGETLNEPDGKTGTAIGEEPM